MFRDRIVGHYVGRGYRVDTDAVLEGASGTKHKVDLVATDDLGRLAVWWGDREPFEGPELESVRRAAKDLDAAPAVATPQATAVLRDNARRLGVVVVDETVLEAEAATMVAAPRPPRPLQPSTVEQDVDYPPWPDPKTDRPQAAPRAAEAPWKRPANPVVEKPWPSGDGTPTTPAPEPEADAPRRAFDWLPEESAPTTPSKRTSMEGASPALMPAFWKPVLLTAVGLLVVLVVVALFL